MLNITRVALMLAMAAATTPVLADNDHLYYEQNRSQYITYEKASQIATEATGGGQVTDIEFDRSLSQADHFDVEVRKPNGQEYDVKIDAKTGKVISKHLDD